MTEQITVRGYVATDPESRSLPDGTVVVTFRLASTPRWFDQQAGAWRDGHTNWFSVQAFRSLGLNALASIKKGQPVVVVGKLKVRFWEGEHGRNTAVDVDAVSLGHDLALGTACFQRTVSSSPPAEQTGDRPAGQPEDAAATGAADAPAAPDGDLSESSGDPDGGGGTPAVPEDVDPETGELLGAAARPGRRPRRQPATA
ncbi:single-stranded DNA-binding protein [Kocuria sp. CPCC 205263]|uniref:single-stranded DNA-binding protein n=1 Tax=Kocuria sp. CPCC 205263 TaxID=3073555 RepID=UPI0034D5E9C2